MSATVTRDPEVLPTHPGNHHLPWHPDPSFFAAIEVVTTDLSKPVITSHDVEVLLATDRTHEGFMSRLRFKSKGHGDSTFAEWLDWMKTRDPINDDPDRAREIRERIEEDRRGPGMAKRPRPAKKVAKKASTKISKAQAAESAAKVAQTDAGPAKVVRPNFQQGSEGGCYS